MLSKRIMAIRILKRNLLNIGFLTFILISFCLYIIENRQGLFAYYMILTVVLVLLIIKRVEIFSISVLKTSSGRYVNKWLFLSGLLLLSILISNILLFVIQSRFLNDHYTLKKHFDVKYAYVFFIYNSVRVLGEELIFRGFLLINEIKKRKELFWVLNISQAILFSFIHSLFVDELIDKIVFTSYVFIFSVYAGWINHKFNSLLPSWLVHWMNGLLSFYYIF